MTREAPRDARLAARLDGAEGDSPCDDPADGQTWLAAALASVGAASLAVALIPIALGFGVSHGMASARRPEQGRRAPKHGFGAPWELEARLRLARSVARRA